MNLINVIAPYRYLGEPVAPLQIGAGSMEEGLAKILAAADIGASFSNVGGWIGVSGEAEAH